MRGDRPIKKGVFTVTEKFTPHARGSTYINSTIKIAENVYPACAGIDPLEYDEDVEPLGLPRMRGDRPRLLLRCAGTRRFTPHARGSTQRRSTRHALGFVYPACAGIDLREPDSGCGHNRLPRMRGDRPTSLIRSPVRIMFTPHARGSTVEEADLDLSYGVYPACAGIDPITSINGIEVNRLPRMRGDRPPPRLNILPYVSFTPHARGSTLG